MLHGIVGNRVICSETLGAGGYVAFSPHRVLASVFGSSKKNKRSADLLEDNSFLFILQLFL